MGDIDKLTARFMNHNDVFADAFNFFLYKGEKVIDSDSLKPLDTRLLLDIFNQDKTKQSYKVVQKYRDVFKKTVIKYNDVATYVLLGIENQTDIHYAMPVRNMIYDALSYGEQVSSIARHNKEKKLVQESGEFLSGFLKTNRLFPVITLVILFGDEKWDGPLTLHEMLDTDNDVVLKYTQNYRINLIEPSGIKEDELKLFTSDLKEVMTFIKYSKDSEKIKEHYLDRGEVMVDNDALRVIETVTNVKMPKKKGKRKTDMCEAIRKLIEEENIKVIQQMEEENIKVIKQMEEENIKVIKQMEAEKAGIIKESERKINDAVIHKIIELFVKGKLNLEEAAHECNLTVEDFMQVKEEYENSLQA
ncbi:MAG: hypothetical protein ACI4WM_00645 [Erysipelotrichaceae bacterium]